MDDLNDGLQNPDAIMLGGGNPAQIPQALTQFEAELSQLLSNGKLLHSLTNYDGPQGKDVFVSALAQMFHRDFGWPISKENIALTNGSQSSFFYLFNLLAGECQNQHKKVLLPLAPEYIGYADTGLSDEMFISVKPKIDMLSDGQFKYHIDFDALEISDDIGLICVSRPTNPTGNVLTDLEIEKLDQLARAHQIPLLIDNAYGLPFPNIVFTDAKPHWNDNTILCLSLSKLGLPGSRCGIVIAQPEIIRALANLNGITNLAPGSVGPAIATQMIEQNRLQSLCDDVITPYYQAKSQATIALIRQHLDSEQVLIHKSEGAIFLWLWFPHLPISSVEFYRRLKARGVLVVPGEHFFIGLQDQNWPHAKQCLRLNYVQADDKMAKGIAIIAEVYQQLLNESAH
ncbi:Valine--pyruvate aminotransferase [Vibrio stylophorae]|uniref:Valine--pyruvate aminotransferase n=2 Tax=Vibrio stylophorae TaxID=659351 RepID=A0ABM8ZWP8_9VIBR|nr:Valine--pyruvate aminotransferase [Vibrio stylophorae]